MQDTCFMQPQCPVQGVRFLRDGGEECQEKAVLCEHLLTIRVNGVPCARLVCSPSDLEDLTLGYLLTEGLASDVKEVEALSLSLDGGVAEVKLRRALHAPDDAEEMEVTSAGYRRGGFVRNHAAPLRPLPNCRWEQA